jgi:hypothetical protein
MVFIFFRKIGYTDEIMLGLHLLTSEGQHLQWKMNLPPGGGTLYAAQVVCVGFHSSPGEGACGSYKPKSLFRYISMTCPKP